MERWRNVLIIVAIAAGVAFLPGAGTGASVVGGALSTLILVCFVLFFAYLYRERRMELEGLGDRWRLLLYSALAAIVLLFAATGRLFATGLGTLVWIAALAGCVYVLVLVWRQYRAYA